MMKAKSYFILLLILFLISLAFISYLSTFTRLHADDYCIAADFNKLNTVSFLAKWFSSWTGRFSYLLFAGFLSLGGPTLTSWLPTIGILIWMLVLSWAILPITQRLKIDNPLLISFNAAAFILWVLFSVTPNLFQSVFWKDGLINYCFPLIGFSMLMGVFSRVWIWQIKNNIVVVLIMVLCFINGGFSEVFSIMQEEPKYLCIWSELIMPKISIGNGHFGLYRLNRCTDGCFICSR